MPELPQRLKDAQDEIAAIHKADALTQLVGKFYSRHEGTGYPTHLRRIFLDDKQEVTVEDYHKPHNYSEFHFKTYKITEAATMQNNYNYSEIEGKSFYHVLDMFLSFKPINSLIVLKQGKEIEALKTKNRKTEETSSQHMNDKWKLQEKIDNVKSAFSSYSWSKPKDDKLLLENIKRILGIEKND